MASRIVWLLVLVEFDKDGNRTVHGAEGIGISHYRFCHDGLKRGCQDLKQEYQRTVEQNVAFSFSNEEIQSHARLRIPIRRATIFDLCHVDASKWHNIENGPAALQMRLNPGI